MPIAHSGCVIFNFAALIMLSIVAIINLTAIVNTSMLHSTT